MSAYLLRVAIAFDAFVQALFRYGTLGVTISARAGTAKAKDHRWGCWLCAALDWLDPGHCGKAIKNDRRRARAVLKELEGYP
jgi:hypothetical protein